MDRADRLRIIIIAVGILLKCWTCAFALNPTLDVSQYAHTAWKVSDGFFTGIIFSIAQTPDGYLWIGTDSGLVRFDGVRPVRWQPPAGSRLPTSDVRVLVAAHDGRLWIGTTRGLASWKDGGLTQYPELDGHHIYALVEDREGTIWVGTVGLSVGRLCKIQGGGTECYGEDGRFGSGVTALYEDSRGSLWAGSMTGVWRWKPGPPEVYPVRADPDNQINALIESDDGGILAARDSGITKLRNGKTEPFPLPAGLEFQPGRLLRDRHGALWIGAIVDSGLLHVQEGKTDLFTQSDGLSGNTVSSLLEDREGNVWVATVDGLNRFRDVAVATLSIQQGLASHAVLSVVAAKDGSIWMGTDNGLNKWTNGAVTAYRKRRRAGVRGPSPVGTLAAGRRPDSRLVREIIDDGLPTDSVDCLFEDSRGQIWVTTNKGVAILEPDRFVPVSSVPPGIVYSITEDRTGTVWLSHQEGLLRVTAARVVERIPWAMLGRPEPATALLDDDVRDGLWLGFRDGGVAFFKQGQLTTTYATGEGLGGLHLDARGTLWAATQGGLSRIKNGHVATLTQRNGLPCDTVHWMMEGDSDSVWLYTACGLVRLAQSELDAWTSNPTSTIHATVFDSVDGVRTQQFHSGYSPIVAKAADGKIWFVPFGGVSVIDPHHLAFNDLPPPVHIEQVTADDKTYDATNGLRLPPRIRNLAIDYTALSLVAPNKVRFRYVLEGQNPNWHEVVNDRQVQYTNLAPGTYTFRVQACNNSGVWNEAGAVLDFAIAPAFYQTWWFRSLCAAAFLALLWAAYLFRVHQLQRESKKLRDVIDTIPGNVWSALPDGSVDFINRRWLEFSGVSSGKELGRGWEAAVHPDDLAGFVDEWRAAVACGKAMESEARVRRADGQYRWLLIRNVPLHDQGGKIVKWYGTSTDIDDRKRAEEALSRSNRELRAISNCNQTLLRATEEQSLLDEICRIVCEEAGYRLAWVGYAEHDEAKSVRPVAWTGTEEGYLVNLGITCTDTERGGGPTGTAIRSGKTCCIQDFATDPRLAPWRERALQRDFRSGIALPLKDEHAHAFGSLTIYSTQPDAFTSEEIRLLEELAADLAFGIVTLRSRAARKRAEEALRESKAYLAEAQGLSHTGSWAFDLASDKYVYVSEECFRIFELGAQEGLPNREAVSRLIHPEDWDGVKGSFEKSVHEKVDTSSEFRLALPDGTMKHIGVIRHPVLNGAGDVVKVVGTAIDITERKRAEEERERLRQLEADLAHINRVSTIGELAASIAHEVNQPLAGVVSNASASLRWLAGEVPNLEEVREGLQRIVRDGKRAGEVIARIRALTRRAEMPREQLDLNDTLREVLALVGDEAKGKSVIIRTRFAEDLSPVSGDRVQLQQVVLNLVMNGIEAMSSVGERARELLITTGNVDADRVQVSVEDSGIGIDPQKLDKIFDSFYTTKPSGMGMGLSISRSILQAHGGRLWATAKDGPGTIFHFTLPKYPQGESHAGVTGV